MEPEHLTVRGLTLVDASGRSRIRLACVNGAAQVQVLDQNGVECITIECDDTEAGVEVRNATGSIVGSLAVGLDKASIELSRASGESVRLTAGEGSTALSIAGSLGKRGILARSDSSGYSELSFSDEQGKVLSSMTTDLDGSARLTLGKSGQGTSGMELVRSPDGASALEIFDSAGFPRLRAGVDRTRAGSLAILLRGRPAVYVGMRSAGDYGVWLCGSSGEVIGSFQLDEKQETLRVMGGEETTLLKWP